jgi:hypothetical protein
VKLEIFLSLYFHCTSCEAQEYLSSFTRTKYPHYYSSHLTATFHYSSLPFISSSGRVVIVIISLLSAIPTSFEQHQRYYAASPPKCYIYQKVQMVFAECFKTQMSLLPVTREGCSGFHRADIFCSYYYCISVHTSIPTLLQIPLIGY